MDAAEAREAAYMIGWLAAVRQEPPVSRAKMVGLRRAYTKGYEAGVVASSKAHRDARLAGAGR